MVIQIIIMITCLIKNNTIIEFSDACKFEHRIQILSLLDIMDSILILMTEMPQ